MLGKVLAVVGTRPEAIKMAPVILAMRASGDVECRVCSTGQHRQILDQVLPVFGIVPDADLGLMTEGQGLAGLTSRAVAALDAHLAEAEPDLMLVQGDTTSVFCAALAGFYRGVAVGHVEAGLRTGNMASPWPEEANRVLTSRLATLHFAPTPKARANLLAEGVDEGSVHVTGNTVIDSLLFARERIEAEPPEVPGLARGEIASWEGRRVVLMTGHRRENFGEGFESICRAVLDLARDFPEARFVYPVHPNPNVRGPVGEILGSGAAPNVYLVDPLPYLAFVAMMCRADVILTDSGGVQEEAPSLGKPVVVMRDTTERPEAVEAGTVRLVGTERSGIVRAVTELLTDPDLYDRMSRAHNPYGDGKASERIVGVCRQWLAERRPGPKPGRSRG